MEIVVDTGKRLAAARCKLEGYISCAGKKVKDVSCFKINAVLQNIKEAFFGSVSGWSRREVGRSINSPAFKCTAYYSHVRRC